MKKNCVIKRKGHEEKYDEKKVYASVYSASLNCEYSTKQSEKIAKGVTKKLTLWIKSKECVNSNEIMDKIISFLNDEDVILMYKSHLDLS